MSTVVQTVKFAASGLGSFWWEGGVLLKKAIAPLGYDLALDEKPSDFRNVLSVADGTNLIGITMPQFVDWAERGFSAFKDKKIPELRVIAALNLPVWLGAAVDRASGITSLKELAEKKYPWKVVLPAPANLVGEYIEYIMAAHGITRESIISWGGADLRPTLQKTPDMRAKMIRETGRDEMISVTRDLAKSGETNGFFLYINGCSAWGRDLTILQDLRFLTFDEAALDAVNAKWGGTKITLPARLFPGVDEDMPAVGWRHHYIYGGTDVPDDLAEAVLKALEDERILDNGHGFSYSGFRPQLVAGVKLHRASEAYYNKRRYSS
jgi:TRAP-type uncharacterized transport system substrate-binding protein